MLLQRSIIIHYKRHHHTTIYTKIHPKQPQSQNTIHNPQHQQSVYKQFNIQILTIQLFYTILPQFVIQTQRQPMKNNRNQSSRQVESSSQYEQEINDKLNDLWSQMKQRKNQIIRSVIPSYSRKSEPIDDHSQSHLNISRTKKEEIYQQREAQLIDKLEMSEKETLKLKNKLTIEINNNKLKDVEIEELKQRIYELTNEKKMMQIDKQKESKRLQTTKINIAQKVSRRREAEKENKNYQSNLMNESSIIGNNIPEFQKSYAEGAKGDTERLLELLRSTEEYKQFVFYFDNNELSFLRNLGRMRRKNCACNLSQREKTLWAPKDVLQIMRTLNMKDEMGLDDEMIERIVYNLNLLYLQRQKVKLQDQRGVYEKKIQLVQRKANATIPYQIVQIQRHKERELLKNRGRSRSSVRR